MVVEGEFISGDKIVLITGGCKEQIPLNDSFFISRRPFPDNFFSLIYILQKNCLFEKEGNEMKLRRAE